MDMSLLYGVFGGIFDSVFGRIMAAFLAFMTAWKVNNMVVASNAKQQERTEITRQSNETAQKRDKAIRKDRRRRPVRGARQRLRDKYARPD